MTPTHSAAVPFGKKSRSDIEAAESFLRVFAVIAVNRSLRILRTKLKDYFPD
jgi:hypothetical protein